MRDAEARATALVQAPVGCMFLLLAEASRLGREDLAQPSTALTLAARALADLRVTYDWHTEWGAQAMRHGDRLYEQALSLVDDPRNAWWYGAPGDDQLWIGRLDVRADPATPDVPSRPPDHWERYAQKPRWGLFTSTVIDGTTSMLSGVVNFAGDLGADFQPPFARWLLRVDPAARVYAIRGPDDWRALCTRFPDPMVGSGDDPLIQVPDFAAVAREWDGVHLTLGGLLSTEQVRTEADGVVTEHCRWDAEQTVWLRWVFRSAERLDHQIDLPDERDLGIVDGRHYFPIIGLPWSE